MMSMIQNYSISKKGNLGDDCGGCDLLSDLPLCIIHIILGLIPIREAVRTSVLSTQWRYTWTTLPHLEFDDRCATNEEFEKFITRVLFRHKGPIHKFKMSCPCNFEYLDEWILYLSRNDIQQLDLCYDHYHHCSALKVHSSIYSCKKMTILRLCGCILDPPPLNFKGFLFLRFLSLGMVSLSPDEVNSLVAVCPLLEIFELLEMEEFYELKISAPNLKYMNIEGCHTEICINAPLMTAISVEFNSCDLESPDQELKSLVCDYAKCFAGFSNLQKLFGSGDFIKYLSCGIELCHHSLVFHHLKVIHLDHVNSEDGKQMMVVAHLVSGALNIQELHIGFENVSWEDDESDSEAPLLSFKDLGCPVNLQLEKLTDVSLYCVNGLTLEVEFLKFLLEGSPALETMYVKLVNDTKKKWNNLRAKLEGCNWASPTVKLRDGWPEPLSSIKHRRIFRRFLLS